MLSCTSQNVIKLTAAQLITNLCDKMLLVSSVWFMTVNYGKHWLTALLVFSTLPHLASLIFSSKIIRRYTPLYTMIASDYFRFFVFIGMGTLMYFAHHINPFLLLITFLLANSAAALFNPAMLSLPLVIAEKSQLQRIMSLISSTVSISRIVGPALAVGFYQFGGLTITLLIAAIGYFVAATLEIGIKMVGKNIYEVENKLENFRLGIREFYKRYRFIFQMLILFFVINLFFVPLQLYMPLYSRFIFDGTLKTLSGMEISLGLGALAATLILTIFQWQHSIWTKVVMSYLAMSAAYLAFASSTVAAFAYGSLFLLGAFSTVGNIVTLNLLQVYPEVKDVPAIMAFVNFTSVAASPFGMFVAGLFLNFHELHFQVIIYALLTLLITVWVAFLPEFRRFSRETMNYG